MGPAEKGHVVSSNRFHSGSQREVDLASAYVTYTASARLTSVRLTSVRLTSVIVASVCLALILIFAAPRALPQGAPTPADLRSLEQRLQNLQRQHRQWMQIASQRAQEQSAHQNRVLDRSLTNVIHHLADTEEQQTRFLVSLRELDTAIRQADTQLKSLWRPSYGRPSTPTTPEQPTASLPAGPAQTPTTTQYTQHMALRDALVHAENLVPQVRADWQSLTHHEADATLGAGLAASSACIVSGGTLATAGLTVLGTTLVAGGAHGLGASLLNATPRPPSRRLVGEEHPLALRPVALQTVEMELSPRPAEASPTPATAGVTPPPPSSSPTQNQAGRLALSQRDGRFRTNEKNLRPEDFTVRPMTEILNDLERTLPAWAGPMATSDNPNPPTPHVRAWPQGKLPYDWVRLEVEREAALMATPPTRRELTAALRRWDEALARYRRIVAQHPGQVDEQIRLIANDFLSTFRNREMGSNYEGGNPDVLRVLMGLGANCLAQTQMLYGALTQAGVVLPDNQVWGLQNFARHIQLVRVIQPTTSQGGRPETYLPQVQDVLTGRWQTEGRYTGNIYQPSLLAHSALIDGGRTPPFPVARLLLLSHSANARRLQEGDTSSWYPTAVGLRGLPDTDVDFAPGPVPAFAEIDPRSPGGTTSRPEGAPAPAVVETEERNDFQGWISWATDFQNPATRQALLRRYDEIQALPLDQRAPRLTQLYRQVQYTYVESTLRPVSQVLARPEILAEELERAPSTRARDQVRIRWANLLRFTLQEGFSQPAYQEFFSAAGAPPRALALWPETWRRLVASLRREPQRVFAATQRLKRAAPHWWINTRLLQFLVSEPAAEPADRPPRSFSGSALAVTPLLTETLRELAHHLETRTPAETVGPAQAVALPSTPGGSWAQPPPPPPQTPTRRLSAFDVNTLLGNLSLYAQGLPPGPQRETLLHPYQDFIQNHASALVSTMERAESGLQYRRLLASALDPLARALPPSGPGDTVAHPLGPEHPQLSRRLARHLARFLAEQDYSNRSLSTSICFPLGVCFASLADLNAYRAYLESQGLGPARGQPGEANYTGQADPDSEEGASDYSQHQHSSELIATLPISYHDTYRRWYNAPVSQPLPWLRPPGQAPSASPSPRGR